MVGKEKSFRGNIVKLRLQFDCILYRSYVNFANSDLTKLSETIKMQIILKSTGLFGKRFQQIRKDKGVSQ